MQEERWKIVPGYAGRYEVSDRGRVRNIKTGHILRQRAIYYGAFVVPLVRPDLGYTVDARVHMLVAEAFLPNPNGRVYVRHKDGNKANNAVDNLEWGINKSYSQNRRIGNRPCIRTDPDGTEHRFESINEGAQSVYGFGSGVSQCCRGLRPHYLNYKWRYADNG